MIYVECNPDLALVKALGFTRRKLKHSGNKSRVGKALERSGPGCGMVDEDPGSAQPPFFRRAQTVRSDKNVTLKKSGQARVVILSPRLEEWILEACVAAGVAPEKRGLPRNGKDLGKIINIRQSNYEKLLRELLPKSQHLKVLKDFLSGQD